MAGNPYLWSTTAATNAGADSDINWAEGQSPGSVNDSARAVMAGVAGWLKDTNSTLTTGGSANAQSVTSNVAYVALATGIVLHTKAGFSNTTACTLNLTPAGGAPFGAKAIKIIVDSGEADPVANNIRVNGHYVFEYDAAANAAAGAWILLNPSSITEPPEIGVVSVQTFTASGTYTPRATMLFATLECVGGGGGGGGCSDSGSTAYFLGAGGGGSGGYSRRLSTAATIGVSQVVTIGAAGTAGTSGPSNGGTGGVTSVGALCIANGGLGGGLCSIASGGFIGGAGGAASTGDVVAAGAPGGAGEYINGNAVIQSISNSGVGGSSYFGGGGASVIAAGSVTAGIAGRNYGSGGSGGAAAGFGASVAGGAGSSGFVIVTEYSVV